MATPDALRAIALGLPEVYEDTHRGKPAFRVHKRIIAMLSVEGPGAGGAGYFAPLSGARPVAALSLEREDQINMLAAFPEATGDGLVHGRYGFTYVWLDRIDHAALELMIRLAWTHVAPKRLSKPRA